MSLCFLPARYPKGSLHARRAGKPLAGKWVACITGLLGDLDYLSLFLRLPRWSSATSPCALCKCTKRGNTTWRNWQQNAGWIATCWKPAEWRLSTERSTSRIFECSGLTAVLVATDWMHAKYLGADQYFLQVLCICYVLLLEKTPLKTTCCRWRLQSRATTRPIQPGTSIQTSTDSQCLLESLGLSSWEVRQQRSSALGNLCLLIGQLAAMRQMNGTSKYCICFRWAADVKKFSLRTRLPWPSATWIIMVETSFLCHVHYLPCIDYLWSRWWRCSSLPRCCLCLWALGSLTLVPLPRDRLEKARAFHMHQ